jgi:outer membrane protein TolC
MVMGTYQPFPVLTARGAQRSQWRVEQQVPFPGKLGLQGDIAGLSAEVAEHEAATFEEDLLFQVKQAYYELYRLQEQALLVEDFQERLLAFEDVAATQYEVGTGMQQAILKAQLEKNTLSQRLIDLAERRQTAIETLARLINQPIEGDFEVRVAPPALLTTDTERLVEIAQQRRPEVDALAAAETRVQKQIALAQKQFLPDFGLNLTYFDMAASDVMPTATGRDALALGVSVKVPLQRGRLRAQLEEAKVRAAQVTARQEALTTSFQTQIADLVSQLHREAEQLTLYQGLLIPQAETTLEATLSAYTTARTDFLNLLDTERMLFTLKVGYADALARYLKAAAGLERALGIDTLADFKTR